MARPRGYRFFCECCKKLRRFRKEYIKLWGNWEEYLECTVCGETHFSSGAVD